MKKILAILMTSMLFACGQKVEKKEVVVKTNSGDVFYNLEIAQSEEDMKKGLMFRESLEENSGMIFLFSDVKGAIMWMKNTLIPLDMLFVAPDGKIVCIKENAIPLSEEFIVCDEVVNSVIEINGGEVEKHKIAIGDIVIK